MEGKFFVAAIPVWGGGYLHGKDTFRRSRGRNPVVIRVGCGWTISELDRDAMGPVRFQTQVQALERGLIEHVLRQGVDVGGKPVGIGTVLIIGKFSIALCGRLELGLRANAFFILITSIFWLWHANRIILL